MSWWNKQWTQARLRRVSLSGLGLAVATFLICGGMVGLKAPIQFLFQLVFGWLFFIGRVVPEITVSWPGVMTGLVALVGFSLGLHGLIRHFTAQAAQPTGTASDSPDEPPDSRSAEQAWSWKQTSRVVCGIVCLFVAGLAITGIVHQVAWMLTSQQPMTSYTGIPERDPD